jgi:UDP-N-acetyl-D-mannosaminuronate dehydrogenase
MENFKQQLLKTKRVSVWGAGYLGYTKILKLQSRGFKVNLFDFTNIGLRERIKKGNYPDKEQIYSWSIHGNILSPDYSKISLLANPSGMFDNNVHILAFPARDKKGYNYTRALAKIFIAHKAALKDALVIFQSAGVPGMCDKDFISLLKNCRCKANIVCAFRSDWNLEEFLSPEKQRVIAADSEESLRKAALFYNLLGTKIKILPNIKVAELYENAKNALQYVNTMFINQLAFAYPDTNIREMTKYLLEDVKLNESHLSVGAGGCKIPLSVENILQGSKNPRFLSLIKESQDSNMSMIFMYAEKIKRLGCKSVTLMGISVQGNQKDIDLSPSIVIAEYLNKLGIKVFIDDPLYDEPTIGILLPACKKVDVLKDGLKSEALLLMANHDKYKYVSQEDINSLGIRNARIIIDNVGIFKGFSFSPKTKYHLVGDGRLGIL